MRAALLALAGTVVAATAHAHPLGNFTINRYAALRAAPGAVTVHYVVDMAEIPAFQELALIDANGDHMLDDAEQRAYLDRMGATLREHLELRVDGTALPLALGATSLERLPGAGGLPTLRIEASFSAPLHGDEGTIDFHDTNFAGRPGWQEVVADGADGAVVSASTVPRTDRSQALRAYPQDLLESPPQVTVARFHVARGTGPVGGRQQADDGVRAGAARFADRMTELIATRTPLNPGFVVTALLVAAGLGALHALSPGHGKTIVGAYLIGTRGTARHAVFLGLVVTATHTIGVYLLGLVMLVARASVMPERLFPWISVASGLVVLAVGVSLATSRAKAAFAGRHDHHHHGHPHDHHHHDHDHGGVGWRNLVALGVSGGLLPCPSALVVMLGAIALGRIAFGLLLIVAFSAGLAAVLTGVGLMLVYARRQFERLPLDGRLARLAPVASALVISAAGLAIVAEALVRIGVWL